jgi:hypothetical protein
MTVGELIEELEKYGKDTIVYLEKNNITADINEGDIYYYEKTGYYDAHVCIDGSD